MADRVSALLWYLAWLVFGLAFLLLVAMVRLDTRYFQLSPLALSGLVFSLGWASLSFRAALCRRAVAWLALCLAPLAVYSLSWLIMLPEYGDPLGFKMGAIAGFVLSSAVTMLSGLLFVLRASRDRLPIVGNFGSFNVHPR